MVGGWVYGVSFFVLGNKFVFGYDFSISVVNVVNEFKMVIIKGDFLFFIVCVWVIENSIVIVGNVCKRYFVLY